MPFCLDSRIIAETRFERDSRLETRITMFASNKLLNL